MGAKGGGLRGGLPRNWPLAWRRTTRFRSWVCIPPGGRVRIRAPPRELVVRRPQDDDSSDMTDGGPYENLPAQDKAEMNAAFRAMDSSNGSEAREE